MVEYLEGFASKSQEFECKELFSKYSIDIVATTGFGIDGQCFTNPDGVFKDQVGLKKSSVILPTMLDSSKTKSIYIS